jgi:hypothetical protein
MEPLEREERQRQARARLLTLKRRASRLRRRILATALVGFVLLWSAIFAQLVTGHDPVLSRSKSGAASRAAAKAPATGGSEGLQGLEEGGGESGGDTEPAPSEAQLSEAQAEEELREIEQGELEQIELEQQELEAVTTGQS